MSEHLQASFVAIKQVFLCLKLSRYTTALWPETQNSSSTNLKLQHNDRNTFAETCVETAATCRTDSSFSLVSSEQRRKATLSIRQFSFPRAAPTHLECLVVSWFSVSSRLILFTFYSSFNILSDVLWLNASFVSYSFCLIKGSIISYSTFVCVCVCVLWSCMESEWVGLHIWAVRRLVSMVLQCSTVWNSTSAAS